MDRFESVRNRLEDEAVQLFGVIAEVHLGMTGDRIFVRADLEDTILIFPNGSHRDNLIVDGGALDELSSLGLLRQPERFAYRVTGEGVNFYRWLRSQQGAAIAQTEAAVRETLQSADFAARHSGSARHLEKAFELLWRDNRSVQATSEIGDHLRKALMDVVNDLVGDAGQNSEAPGRQLEAWLAASTLQGRERTVLTDLVALAASTLRLDHRINHVRDELGKGEPAPSFQELRRAAFTTAFTCYELSEALRTR